jgi:hypothetical protein
MMAFPHDSTTTQLASGGTCADCGFTYYAYGGHLEPCPRCAARWAATALRIVTQRAARVRGISRHDQRTLHASAVKVLEDFPDRSQG